jgi:hypothetical protein
VGIGGTGGGDSVAGFVVAAGCMSTSGAATDWLTAGIGDVSSSAEPEYRVGK